MKQSTYISPIERAITQIWPDAKPSGNTGWYSAKCTGHDDHSASLSFREADNGSIITKCHAGCSRERIIEGAKIKESALHPKGSYRPKYQPRPKYDLIDLAADKLLPWQFLFNLGVEDGYKWETSSGQKLECVRIRYYDITGEEYSKVRVRIGPSGNKDSYWDQHTPGLLIAYGYQWLDLARSLGYLMIGEGESDGWTHNYHGIPYLGVPGAKNTQCLDGSLLNDIPAIYVIQEPDAAGQGFYKDVHKRLRETGYTGKMFALPWQKLTGYKDPNELHRRLRIKDPNDTHVGYQAAIASAIERATPAGDDIDLSVSQMDAEEWVPRSEYEELNARYHTAKEQLDFILKVMAVPKTIMKPTDKLVNIAIDHELRNHAANEKGYAPVNLKRSVTPATGLGYETVLECKKRLMGDMRLYDQETITFFHERPDGKPTQTESILLRPLPVQKYPSFYGTEQPIQWGGHQQRKPACPECGSDNVDIVRGTLCHHCHAVSNEELYTSKHPMVFDSQPVPQSVTIVEEQAITEERATNCQVGTVLNKEKETAKLAVAHVKSEKMPELPTGDEIASICKQHGLRQGVPCEQCGCPVQRNMAGEWVCCRCYPKGYHLYSDVIDKHYPRRRVRVGWKAAG